MFSWEARVGQNALVVFTAISLLLLGTQYARLHGIDTRVHAKIKNSTTALKHEPTIGAPRSDPADDAWGLRQGARPCWACWANCRGAQRYITPRCEPTSSRTRSATLERLETVGGSLFASWREPADGPCDLRSCLQIRRRLQIRALARAAGRAGWTAALHSGLQRGLERCPHPAQHQTSREAGAAARPLPPDRHAPGRRRPQVALPGERHGSGVRRRPPPTPAYGGGGMARGPAPPAPP